MSISYVNNATNSDNNNSNTSISVSKPTSTSAGNTLILLLALEQNNPDNTYVTPPTGFSLITEQLIKGTNGLIISYWKTAGGSEPSSYTVSWSSGSESSVEMLCFSGCHQTSPIQGSSEGIDKGVTTIQIGSLSPSTSGTMFVGAAMMDYASNSDSFTSIYDSQSNSWTQLSDVGNNSNSEPVLGSGYALVSNTNTASIYVTNNNGAGEVGGVSFNLQESSIIGPADITSGYTFTAAGTYYVTVPYGCSYLRMDCWGGGGCGSGATRRTSQKLGGGGGGGYSRKGYTTAAPGCLIKIIVGAGGTSAGTNNGGDTIISISDSTWDHTNFSTELNRAYGGTGVAADTQAGGAGGAGGTGSPTYTGGNGATTNAFSTGGRWRWCRGLVVHP